MTSKFSPQRYFCTVLITLLAACGPLVPEQIGTPTATSAPNFTPVIQSPTVRPAETPLVPSPTLLRQLPLNNLRMAYIVDGNLYIQDGSNAPIPLTNSRADLDPIFSDDGEKIVFYRGKINDNNNVYSINADGSQEQALITNDWLTTLGSGTKAGPLAFVPSTHRLMFNTYLCAEDLSLGCTTGLFLVDTDTGGIKELLPPSSAGYLPFGGGSPWHGNFKVSPDGELLSVAMSGHIDIFNIAGKVIRRNIMTYTRSTPIELFPRVYWLPDISGLIVALPAESNYGGGYEMTPTYSVWRYSFDPNTAVQIPLEPSPMWIYMECSDVMYVSPDGNWVIFNRLEDNAQLYAGNLSNWHTQSYQLGIDCSPAYWSADNRHFVYGRLSGTFLGAADKPLIPIDGNFLGWVDATHFIYSRFPNERNILIGVTIEKTITTYRTGIFLQEGYNPYSVKFVILDYKADR